MTKQNVEVTLVMPCYNEESAIRTTAEELVNCFLSDGTTMELILVDNGSTDRTGEIIDDLIKTGHPIKKIKLDKNQGYGGGILAGLKSCESPVVGYLCADGQVSAEDTLMAYRLIRGRENRTITKVRRIFRRDGWKRKIVSIVYNVLMQILFGRLGAIDINGSPKIFSRKIFDRMELTSKDWFLDPEIILKAKYLGLRVIEVDVEGHARKGGASNVKVGTSLEFLKNIFKYRFGFVMKDWKQSILQVEKSDADHLSSKGLQICKTAPIDNKHGSVQENVLQSVRIVAQKRHEDPRGFLQKMLTASQCSGTPPKGEVYVTSALPGQSKGNHYHKNMGEWFSVVQGEGEIKIKDPKSGVSMSVLLGVSTPQTVYVPAGLAHSIINKSKDILICVAWAEKEHDPEDVHPYNL